MLGNGERRSVVRASFDLPSEKETYAEWSVDSHFADGQICAPFEFDELAVLPTMHLPSVSGTTPLPHAYAH